MTDYSTRIFRVEACSLCCWRFLHSGCLSKSVRFTSPDFAVGPLGTSAEWGVKKYGRSAHLVENQGEADAVWCFKAQISKTFVFTGDAQQPNYPLSQELERCELSVSIWQLICQSFRLLVGIILSPSKHANPPPILSGGNMSSPMARTAGQTHMHTAQ